MKIIEFKIGKKYRHIDWETQDVVGYFGEMPYLKKYNEYGLSQGSYAPYHDEAISDGWYEVKEKDCHQEILDLKNEIVNLREKLLETKFQLQKAIEIMTRSHIVINSCDKGHVNHYATHQTLKEINDFLQQKKEPK